MLPLPNLIQEAGVVAGDKRKGQEDDFKKGQKQKQKQKKMMIKKERKNKPCKKDKCFVFCGLFPTL